MICTVRRAAADDISSILRIADSELGEDYLQAPAVKDIIGDQDQSSGFVLVAERLGEVSGFSLCLEQSVEAAEEMMKCLLPQHIGGSSQIGALKTVAVEKSVQGSSLGSWLVGASVELLKKRGSELVYTVAWESPDGRVGIDSIIKRLGFTEAARIPGYWSEESLKEGFSCPACPQRQCLCAAVISTLV